jgi:hypothetical protein
MDAKLTLDQKINIMTMATGHVNVCAQMDSEKSITETYNTIINLIKREE